MPPRPRKVEMPKRAFRTTPLLRTYPPSSEGLGVDFGLARVAGPSGGACPFRLSMEEGEEWLCGDFVNRLLKPATLRKFAKCLTLPLRNDRSDRLWPTIEIYLKSRRELYRNSGLLLVSPTPN